MVKQRTHSKKVRIAFLVLCATILLSSINIFAFAKDGQEPYIIDRAQGSDHQEQPTPSTEDIVAADTIPVQKQKNVVTVVTYDELVDAIRAVQPMVPVTIVIGADLTLNEGVTIESGKDITLVDDGAEKTISAAKPSPMFTIHSGGKLTLSSSNSGSLLIDGQQQSSQMSSTGRIIHCNGTFVLGGAILGNAVSIGNYSGVVYISGTGSLFEMLGGEIRENEISGGGLTTYNATVYATAGANVRISGGKITNNKAEDVRSQGYTTAGILARSKDGPVTIEMTGGEISNNVSRGDGDGGGGVWLCADTWVYGYQKNPVTMTMSGDAKIIQNTASYGGGGVFVYGNATFTMYAGEISGNTVTNGMGGGVATYDYLKSTGQDDDYIEIWEQFVHTGFVMHGGRITGNTADRADSGFGGNDGGCGGGVYVASNNVELRGGEIIGNTASRQGGGVYVGSTPYTLYMYDALVTENSAALLGGGMWLCPTGTAESYVENGGAVFENTSQGAGDDIASLSKTGGATLSLTNRLLGNWLVHWYEDGAVQDNSGVLGEPVVGAPRYPNTQLVGGIITSADDIALKAVAAEEGKVAAKAAAKLLVSGNTAPRGGGIGSNGAVIFNKYPVPYPTVDVSVKKNWSPSASAHPDSVVVYLIQDRKRVDRIVLSEENDWAFTFRDLPKYQNNALETDEPKAECVYEVWEEPIDGYTSAVTVDANDGYAFLITNTKESEEGDVAVNVPPTDDAADWRPWATLMAVSACCIIALSKSKDQKRQSL